MIWPTFGVYSMLVTIGVTPPSNSYHLPLLSELGSTLEISPSLTASDQHSLPQIGNVSLAF